MVKCSMQFTDTCTESVHYHKTHDNDWQLNTPHYFPVSCIDRYLHNFTSSNSPVAYFKQKSNRILSIETPQVMTRIYGAKYEKLWARTHQHTHTHTHLRWSQKEMRERKKDTKHSATNTNNAQQARTYDERTNVTQVTNTPPTAHIKQASVQPLILKSKRSKQSMHAAHRFQYSFGRFFRNKQNQKTAVDRMRSVSFYFSHNCFCVFCISQKKKNKKIN